MTRAGDAWAARDKVYEDASNEIAALMLQNDDLERALASTREALAALARHLQWHQFRPWSEGGGTPRPNPTACGGCSAPEALHPRPRLYIGGLDDQWAAGLVLARIAPTDDGASQRPDAPS